MALKAYIDGSGGGGSTLILAGYIGAAEEHWMPFADRWDARLKEAGLSRFKMSDLYSRPEIAAFFYRLIEEHVAGAVACAVPRDALRNAAKELDLEWVKKIDNPYYFAVKAIINMTAQHQQKMGLREPIDFIFDEQSEQKAIRDAWDAYLASPITADVKALTGALPQFLKDDDVPALQAADLFAWWMRIQWERYGTLCREELPFPWALKRDIPRLMMEFDQAAIRTELERGRDALVAKGELVPPVQVTVGFRGLDGEEF